MTEVSESLAVPRPRLERPIGELALKTPDRRDLFQVTPDEVRELVPSVTECGQAFVNVVLAMNPANKSLHGEQEPEEIEAAESEALADAALGERDLGPQTPGRATIRSSKNTYGRQLAKVIQTGAQYLATFDDPEEGIRTGREIIDEETDGALGNIYMNRIVPAAPAIRELRDKTRGTMAEVRAVVADDSSIGTARRYTLLKALGQTKSKDGAEPDKPKVGLSNPGPGFTLTASYIMDGSDEHKQLVNELSEGAYDRLIARDILHFLDTAQTAEGDLGKVQQLVKCLYVFAGQPDDRWGFYDRMVDTLDTWPMAQQQVIQQARMMLRERLESNLGVITRALRNDDFLIDDPEDAFHRSFENFADELLRRTQIHPGNKVAIMQLRAQIASGKRARLTSKRTEQRAARKARTQTDDAATAETEDLREPMKVVTCNLNDYSIGETATAMVDEFVTAASQGNVTVRADVERMLSYMARRDLPRDYRRGVKVISGTSVRFGLEEDPDKLWILYEFKPTEAAGLSLKTQVAKNSRIYFIKMDDETIGVVGIQPRATQEQFLRSIRVKNKHRE